MNVLFVLDPLEGLKAYKDSSVAMMFALHKRGHHVTVAMQGDLFILTGRVHAVTQAITLHPGADLHGHEWYSITEGT